MQFEWQDHHFISGRRCLDLANTVVYARDPVRREDRLGDPEAALDWMSAAARKTWEPVTGYDRRRLYLEALSTRNAIDALFRAQATGQPVPAAAWRDLIAIYASFLAGNAEGLSPGVDGLTAPAGAGGAAGFLATLAHDGVTLALSTQMNRVKECPGCNWLFVDTTRNGRKRWCEMRTCGNRAKARRYSERMRSTA